ncbi:MAG: ATP-binding protein [Candidatus Sumerlaeota bacterium]|nr:ATP-binding protein [Candidatus Sumerlaeota bacterium]
MPSVASARTFAGKFLEKLDKISREEIEAFLFRLQKSKAFFEGILDHLLEGVLVTDPEGRVLFINRAARALLGIGARRRVVGTALLECIPDGELHDILRAYDPQRQRIHSQEAAIHRPDERIFNVTLIPVRDDSGALASIVTLLQDLTIRRREEEQRIRTERLASLATLTAGVAHEIKNPLNSLGLHAHLLRRMLERGGVEGKGEEGERLRRSAEVVIEETERLSRIVDDFLQAARPSKPQFEMKSVNEALRRLAQLMEAEAAQRGIQVDLELDADISPSRIDEAQLLQAFRNIVKNAIEAIDHDHGRIQIRSRQAPDAIQVQFRDNGCGISREQIQRVFEPYVTSKFYGTGLGLMIVHRIIADHRGFVTIHSDAGEGTIVRIALPLGPQPRQLLPERTGGQT